MEKQMERLLSVTDIMERYHLKCRQTAAKKMHEMDSLIRAGKKLLVPESAVIRYDSSRMTHPPEVVRAAMRMQKKKRRSA